jgi:integrase
MALRKRGDSWQIDYIDPNGKRVRQSFKKKGEATAELGKRISLIAENPKRYLEISKARIVTFDELTEKYEENFKHQRSFATSKKYSIDTLKKEFSGRLLGSISYLHLESFRNQIKNTLTQHGTIRKEATVNRLMACLSHMLTKAVEWEMLDRNPFDKGRSLQFKENNKRLRYLTEAELKKLLAECPNPAEPRVKREMGVIKGTQAPYLKDFVVIAVNTGMRKGEILSLKWSQIRNGFIYVDKTKTDEARQIPINRDLEECFKNVRTRQQLTSQHVFSNGQGGFIRDVRTSFKSALRRAGILDFHPHDLRHTFASHYLMRGGSLKGLKEVLGHKDIKMTMRYAHLSKEFVKEEIEILNGLTAYVKLDTSQNVTNDIFVTKKGLAESANPLKSLVELDGIEPTAS